MLKQKKHRFHRHTKRLWALCLCLALACAGCTGCTAFAAEPDPTEAFGDIGSHWAKPAIRFCLENGYMSGLEEGRFGPDEPATRAQTVRALYAMAGSPSTSGMDCPFVDIGGHEARRAIFWAYNVRLASGAGGNSFLPDGGVSREQAAVFFKNYREASLGESVAPELTYLDSFRDRDQISGWAREAVNWAVQAGLMGGGSGPDRLDPQDPCTRAQLAMLIQNYFLPFQSLPQWEEAPKQGQVLSQFRSNAGSNSELVSYVRMSPNHSGRRRHKVDTITIHCMAGDMTVEQCGELFADPARQASSNYAIGSDGRIAQYVDERNRSWCSSSAANDHRAVTIEVANNGPGPSWPVSQEAYESLIDLVTDICWRNGIKRLLWQGDRGLIGQVEKQNMTVHRWFADKSCPGEYLYSRHGDIADQVNRRLAALETGSALDQALDAALALHPEGREKG